MELIIFGASGLLGTRLVTEALDRGHEVTAVARDACRLDDRDGRVRTSAPSRTTGRRRCSVGGAGSLDVAPGQRLVDPRRSRGRQAPPDSASPPRTSGGTT
jgi:putative NADH-flavin reductase